MLIQFDDAILKKRITLFVLDKYTTILEWKRCRRPGFINEMSNGLMISVSQE